jgi:tetratricopeptide (TPR) repeat protein
MTSSQCDSRRPMLPNLGVTVDAHLLNIPYAIRIFPGRFASECRRKTGDRTRLLLKSCTIFPPSLKGAPEDMRFWMKRSRSEGQGSRLIILCLILSIHVVAFGATDDPTPSTENDPASTLRVGAEVVLKLSGTPIFHRSRQVSSQDNLTFFVEGVESDRIQVVSRDKSVQGWVFSDQIIALERADEHFNRVVANDPRDAEAIWIHARIQYYRNDSERALANVNRAIRLEPDQARYYVTRAVFQLGRQQADRAIEDCDQAIELDPRSARPYHIRAQAWLSKHDTSRALADLELAARLDSTNPSFQAQTATPANAPTIVKASVRDDKTSMSAAELIKRGEDRLASNDYDQALADFSEAIRLNPDHAPAYTSRAQVWAKKHYRDREIDDYTEAIKRDPGNASYRVARAESWSAQGMHKRAMTDFEDALRMEPNNPSFWVSRGNEWRRHLKLDDAIADYSHALQINPRFAAANIARGNTWKQRREFDRAIQEFSGLIQTDPQNALAHMTLARILGTCHEPNFRNGKWALAEANRACELTHWHDPDCLDTLAAACAEVGDYEAAIKWQTEAIKLVRQNVRSLLQQKANSFGGRRGIGFEERLVFYKSKKPTRE